MTDVSPATAATEMSDEAHGSPTVSNAAASGAPSSSSR